MDFEIAHAFGFKVQQFGAAEHEVRFKAALPFSPTIRSPTA
jgi:hypothetical protein